MNSGQPLSEGHLLDGRYRVRKVLGVGGMGRVYLSNDTRLANRPVAVKEMILADGVKEKKAIEDFTREASVLARLSHHGIPTLIDHFAEGGRHYLVMEYVAGADLQAMLDKAGAGARMPENRVVRWARQILDVLDFLHAQNPPIIYRDLKPGNIMIGKDGRAMLIDFGIARFLPPGGRGTQIGSVGYAPPEQYLGKVERRSDLYSLAATMHHLISGRDPQLEPPFSFPDLRELVPGVSQQTYQAVMTALEQDVAKRPSSAKELLRLLPEPAPESDSAVQAGASSLSTLSISPTVVLNAPVANSAPRNSSNPQMSTMKTVVLTAPESTVEEPALVPPRSSGTSGGVIAPSIRKARELTERARAMFKSRLVNRPARASAPRVSSTAKTAELSPAIPSRSASTGEKPTAPTGQQSQRQAPKAHPEVVKNGRAPARLIVRGEPLEFGVFGNRAIIGRSRSSIEAGGLDIDLRAIKQGAERVAARHAEIIRRGAEYFIRDLGSIGGTHVMGSGKLGRDQLFRLKDRDHVVLGGAILQFRID
jgi:serine/threonine protein kinase